MSISLLRDWRKVGWLGMKGIYFHATKANGKHLAYVLPADSSAWITGDGAFWVQRFLAQAQKHAGKGGVVVQEVRK